MAKGRVIYNKNQYKSQEMLLNPVFREKISWLKNKFAEFGCPIPKEGFSSLKEFMDWNGRYMSMYSKVQATPEYQEKFRKATGGKQMFGIEELNNILDLEERLLPPMYGYFYDDLLEEFGIEKTNRDFRDFLEHHIFFNKEDFPNSLFAIRWIRNKETDKMELFIQLFGHTKKEDITNYWDFIKPDLKLLPDYVGRNKEWETFARDNEIYEIFLSIRKGRAKNRSQETKGERAMDREIYSRINSKYPEVSLSKIRGILSRIRDFRAPVKESP